MTDKIAQLPPIPPNITKKALQIAVTGTCVEMHNYLNKLTVDDADEMAAKNQLLAAVKQDYKISKRRFITRKRLVVIYNNLSELFNEIEKDIRNV